MKRAQPEAQIQKAVLAHLKARGAKDMVYWHTPNGGKRNVIEAVRFKAMGVRPGVSDLIFLRNGEAFALELKAADGRPTENQLKFLSDFRNAGGHAVCAEGLNEAIAILETWKLLTGSSQ